MMNIKYLIKELESHGASDVVVNATDISEEQIKFHNSKISGVYSWKEQQAEVFCVYRKRVLVSVARILSKPELKRFAAKMMRFVKRVPVNDEYAGIAEGPFRYKKNKGLYDERIGRLGNESVMLANRGIAASKAAGAKRAAGVFELATASRMVESSSGVSAHEDASSLYFSIRSFVNKHASGHAVSCARNLDRFEVVEAGKESADTALKAIKPKNAPPGRYNVLFSPLAFANIIDQVGGACSAISVEAGLSPFKGKLNKKVASTKLTLWDHGYAEDGLSSSHFDEEGVPTQKNALIKDGVLKTYLHNTSTAKRFKTKTTANAGLLSPEPTNLVVAPGKRKDLLGLTDGLYITNLWYTRFQNHTTGDFSTIPRDGCFLVENGKIRHGVTNIRLSDNLLNVINNVSAVGKDAKQIYGWEIDIPVFTPHVYVKDLNISTPSG